MSRPDAKITFSIDKEQGLMNIKVEGDFNYTCRDNFLAGYQDVTQKLQNCYIDLSKANLMDSSALGLLLTLRSASQLENAKIILDVKDNKTIHAIIQMHNFHKLFEFYSECEQG